MARCCPYVPRFCKPELHRLQASLAPRDQSAFLEKGVFEKIALTDDTVIEASFFAATKRRRYQESKNDKHRLRIQRTAPHKRETD